MQLVAAHHSHFMHGPPRTSPRSWGMPNEIFGSTGAPMFRPTPAVPVLIAGHGPPGIYLHCSFVKIIIDIYFFILINCNFII